MISSIMQQAEHVRQHRRPVSIGYLHSLSIETDISVGILDIRLTKACVLQMHPEGPELNSPGVEEARECRR